MKRSDCALLPGVSHLSMNPDLIKLPRSEIFLQLMEAKNNPYVYWVPSNNVDIGKTAIGNSGIKKQRGDRSSS